MYETKNEAIRPLFLIETVDLCLVIFKPYPQKAVHTAIRLILGSNSVDV